MKSRAARTPTASVTSLLFLGVVLTLVVACGESTAAPETPVVSVTLSATEVDLTVGDTTRLSAVAHSANGVLSGRTFTWSSDRPGFATVDEAGLVTAVGVGVARIFAATGGQSGQASIRVSAPPSTPVGSVVVEPSSSSLEVGDTVRLHAVVRDAGGAELEGRVVAWASDRVDIASVDATGLVRAHASGTANITATVEEESGSAVVEVAVPPTATPSIAFLNPASIQAGWGNFTLKVQGLDIPPQSRVTWNGVPLQSFYVNSTEIQATVSSSYVQAEGTAEVRVETPLPDSRASNALTFTIFARPALSVDILLSGNATVVGDRVRLHAVARDQFGEVIEGKKITWTSSDTTIAKVEGEFLRGLRVGSVQLRAEAYPTFSGTLFRVVESPVQELAFQGSPSGPPELFRRSLEPPGGVLRFFPPLTYGRDLAVSPDGSRIAFAGLASGSNWDIYTANADGSGLTRLTTDAASDDQPAWSPNGDQIVFRSSRQGKFDIWIMNADGSEQVNLTFASVFIPEEYNTDPTWSPDGQTLLFSRGFGIGQALYKMAPDGSGLTLFLARTGMDLLEPAWSEDGFIAFRRHERSQAGGGGIEFVSASTGDPLYFFWPLPVSAREPVILDGGWIAVSALVHPESTEPSIGLFNMGNGAVVVPMGPEFGRLVGPVATKR